ASGPARVAFRVARGRPVTGIFLGALFGGRRTAVQGAGRFVGAAIELVREPVPVGVLDRAQLLGAAARAGPGVVRAEIVPIEDAVSVAVRAPARGDAGHVDALVRLVVDAVPIRVRRRAAGVGARGVGAGVAIVEHAVAVAIGALAGGDEGDAE